MQGQSRGEGEVGPEAGSVHGLWKLEKARKWVLPGASRRNAAGHPF